MATCIKLYDNESVSSGDTSFDVPVGTHQHIEIFGTCLTGTGSLTVQVEPISGEYYDSAYEVNTVAGSDFFSNFNTTVQSVRVKVNQNMSGFTCWLSAK